MRDDKERPLSEEELAWRELRRRQKIVRFSSDFLIDLVKKYGDLPEGTTVRDTQQSFDTGDIEFKCLNPAWPKVDEGYRAERIDIVFKFPVKTEGVDGGTT